MTQDTKKMSLVQQLFSLRQEIYVLCQALATAGRLQDKEGMKLAQEQLARRWDKWDGIIKAVGDIEAERYNVSSILAICQDDK